MNTTIYNQDIIKEFTKTLRKEPKTPIEKINIVSTDDVFCKVYVHYKFTTQRRNTEHTYWMEIVFGDYGKAHIMLGNQTTHKWIRIEMNIANIKQQEKL